MSYRRKPVTPDEIARARDKPLLDYVQRRGYALQKAGRYYRMVEHDSLVIDPQRNRWYWNSRGISNGNTVDFLVEYEGIDFREAVLTLLDGETEPLPVSQKLPIPPYRPAKPPGGLTLPPRDDYAARVFAYLTRTRGIAVRLVQQLIRERLVYEAKGTHNAVFVRYRDGKPVGYFERGTCTYGKPYKHCPPESDKRYEFLLPGNDPQTLIVCEAAIDCLSVETLRRMQKAVPCAYPILSLGGNALPSLDQYLIDHPSVRQLVVCTDGDDGGEIGWQRIGDAYADRLTLYRCAPPPPYKDWNDVLVAVRQKQCPSSVARQLIEI